MQVVEDDIGQCTLSDEPDELLGYLVLGQQVRDEADRLWPDDECVTNTHGCWDFFPVVN